MIYARFSLAEDLAVNSRVPCRSSPGGGSEGEGGYQFICWSQSRASREVDRIYNSSSHVSGSS